MDSILLLLHTHLSCEAAKAAKSVRVEHEYDSKAVRNQVAGIRPREGFFDESIWDGRFKRWRANSLNEVNTSDISHLYALRPMYLLVICQLLLPTTGQAEQLVTAL